MTVRIRTMPLRVVVGKAIIPLVLIVLGLSAAASTADAQTAEGHDVEQLSVEDVGPFHPTTKPELSTTEQEIIERTNAFRKRHDRDPVERNDDLQQTAQDFADYMARTDRYGHSADGRQPSQRARAHDYAYCLVAENIAYRFQTTGFKTEELAREAVTGWRESPGHRENMLRPDVTDTGVAVAQSEQTGVYYLVQLFGRPRSATISFSLTNRTDNVVQYALGDHSFELPPGFTRQHEMCVPAELQIEAGEQSPPPRTPTAGQHLIVTGDEGGLTLREEGPTTSSSTDEEPAR